MSAATTRPSAEDVVMAGRRYRSWGAQEREHADYCRITDRVSWRCWNYLGRHVEAASIAYDLAVAATYANRYGAPHMIAAWMLPTPEGRAS